MAIFVYNYFDKFDPFNCFKNMEDELERRRAGSHTPVFTDTTEAAGESDLGRVVDLNRHRARQILRPMGEQAGSYMRGRKVYWAKAEDSASLGLGSSKQELATAKRLAPEIVAIAQDLQDTVAELAAIPAFVQTPVYATRLNTMDPQFD